MLIGTYVHSHLTIWKYLTKQVILLSVLNHFFFWFQFQMAPKPHSVLFVGLCTGCLVFLEHYLVYKAPDVDFVLLLTCHSPGCALKEVALQHVNVCVGCTVCLHVFFSTTPFFYFHDEVQTKPILLTLGCLPFSSQGGKTSTIKYICNVMILKAFLKIYE